MGFAFAIMICLSLNGPALALNDYIVPDSDVTIINLSKSITPQKLQKIEDLTAENLFDSNYSRISSMDENSYKVTVSTSASEDKIVSDSGYTNGTGYHVSATLQLIWTDVFGLDNVIKKVSGTLTVLEGTVSDDSYVEWGNGWASIFTWTSKKVGDASSFAYYPNETVECPAAGYTIYIKGASVNHCLSVSSSIFQ